MSRFLTNRCRALSTSTGIEKVRLTVCILTSTYKYTDYVLCNRYYIAGKLLVFCDNAWVVLEYGRSMNEDENNLPSVGGKNRSKCLDRLYLNATLGKVLLPLEKRQQYSCKH